MHFVGGNVAFALRKPPHRSICAAISCAFKESEMDNLTLRLRCSHTYTGAECERGRRVWIYANVASSFSMLGSRNANAPLLKCNVGFANGE